MEYNKQKQNENTNETVIYRRNKYYQQEVIRFENRKGNEYVSEIRYIRN